MKVNFSGSVAGSALWESLLCRQYIVVMEDGEFSSDILQLSTDT